VATGMMRGVRPRPGGRPRGSPEGRTLNGPARAWGGAPSRCPAGDPPLARPRKGPIEVPARLPGPPRRGLPLSRRPGASPAWAATGLLTGRALLLPVARHHGKLGAIPSQLI
jgi:hypothetical protein